MTNTLELTGPAATALSQSSPFSGAEGATATTPTAYLERPQGRIAYTEQGSGPAVVMIPGLGDLKEEYRFLGPRLAAAGFRAVAMDLRGHGESTAGWSDYSAEAIGADALALVDRLDAGPAILVGTSMGAGAAAWAAAEAPDKVAGLVLAGPFVRDVPHKSRLKGLAISAMIKVMTVGPWAPSAWGSYYASLYRGRRPDDLDAYVRRLVANFAEPGRMAALRGMAATSKAGVEARLGEIAAPTLVVMGDADPDFADPEAEARMIAARTGGEVLMVAGAGHYPHAEMPDIVGPAIVAFLADGRAG